jgi:hypothetical protein
MSRPLVIELVGPAGVGKSTLWHVLGRRPGVTQASIWDLSNSLYARAALRTLPDMLRVARAAQAIPSAELQQVVRLHALDLRLTEIGRTGSAATVVLDEGPVFALSWFRVIGHHCFRNGSAELEPWWTRTLAHWARRIDVIVLLDAPDPLLVHRLRTRTKPHPFLRRPDQDIYALNQAYRSEYEWLIPALAELGGPRLVSLCADRIEPADLADRVLASAREVVHA